MSKKPEVKIQIMLLGLDTATRAIIESLYSKDQLFEPTYDINVIADKSFLESPTLILVGPPPTQVNIIEVAQTLRMKYPQHAIYFLTNARDHFDRNALKKNGFTDAFLIPMDSAIAIQKIQNEISAATQGKIKSFRPVCLIDIQTDQRLEFNTYMYFPVNRKHIRLSEEGEPFEKDLMDKLKQASFSQIHVSLDQMPRFFTFAAQQLKVLQKGEGMSETEKRERMVEAIRGLLSGIFSNSTSDATIDVGRNIVGDCKEIVKQFITEGSDANNWYNKLLTLAGSEEGSYNHAGNVATFGALFSLAVQLGNPEHVALAALLHDIGLADVDASVQSKNEKDRSREEQESYKKHVDHTLQLIKFRKMILPDPVIKAVQQHHERWSGTGYPKGVGGDRISADAQILALADQFDYLTMTQDGRPRMSPAQAFKEIYEENLKNSSDSQFDLELLKKFLEIFPEPGENQTP
jgi:HD-GYP domain-containing protein (c-di-GMP phosphodiesterase class II)